MPDVGKFYEDMTDKTYVETSTQRSIQMIRILKNLMAYKSKGSLLDIGAGSGLLVEEGLKLGFDSEGIEPSQWLCELARKKLNVHLGVLPHKGLKKEYDIVTLVDIIEHVSNPRGILEDVHKIMSNNGIGVIITPDVSSIMAKILGWNWWHYRMAHIGYFDKKTISNCLDLSGFKILKVSRPSWYFPLDYLIMRVNQYFPRYLKLPSLKIFSKVSFPLNLFDSLQIIFEKK